MDLGFSCSPKVIICTVLGVPLMRWEPGLPIPLCVSGPGSVVLGGFGSCFGGFLEGADFGESFRVDDVGDGAAGAPVAVGAGGFAPAFGLDAALLAEQGEEDLGFLLTEAG